MVLTLDEEEVAATLQLWSMKAELQRLKSNYNTLTSNNKKLTEYHTCQLSNAMSETELRNHTHQISRHGAVAFLGTSPCRRSPLTASKLHELKASNEGFGSGSDKQAPINLPLPKPTSGRNLTLPRGMRPTKRPCTASAGSDDSLGVRAKSSSDPLGRDPLLRLSSATATSPLCMWHPPGPSGGLFQNYTLSAPPAHQHPFSATGNDGMMAQRSSYTPPQGKKHQLHPPSTGWLFVPTPTPNINHMTNHIGGGGCLQKGGGGMYPHSGSSSWSLSNMQESDHELLPEWGHHNPEVDSLRLQMHPLNQDELVYLELWAQGGDREHLAAPDHMDANYPSDTAAYLAMLGQSMPVELGTEDNLVYV